MRKQTVVDSNGGDGNGGGATVVHRRRHGVREDKREGRRGLEKRPG